MAHNKADVYDPNDPKNIAYNESKRGPQGVPMPGFVRDFFSGWRWWGDGPAQPGPTNTIQSQPSGAGSSLSGVNNTAYKSDYGLQRMADLRKAAALENKYGSASAGIGMQPNDPRKPAMPGVGGGRDPWMTGQFTPGGVQAPDPRLGLSESERLYQQLYDLQRDQAQGTYDSIEEWASGRDQRGRDRLANYRTRIGGQLDQQDERRSRDVGRIRDAEQTNTVESIGQLTDDLGAAVTRLNSLGIDPTVHLADVRDEFGGAIAEGLSSGAAYVNHVEMIGNEAADMRRNRIEFGLSEAEADLAGGIADVMAIASMNLQNSLSAIDQAVLQQQISKAEGKELLDRGNAQAAIIAEFTLSNPDAVAAFMEQPNGLALFMNYLSDLRSGADDIMVAHPTDIDEFGAPIPTPVSEADSLVDYQNKMIEFLQQYGEDEYNRAFPNYAIGQ